MLPAWLTSSTMTTSKIRYSTTYCTNNTHVHMYIYLVSVLHTKSNVQQISCMDQNTVKYTSNIKQLNPTDYTTSTPPP